MHEQFMRLALAQAAQSGSDVPVGAVIVRDGQVIASAHNEREAQDSPLAHAEMLAMERACRALHTRRLSGCTLYVTLEPCPMCAGAIVQARPELVVFGAFDGEMGGLGSVYAMHCDERIRGNVPVIGGVRRAECETVMKGFFEKVRRGG